jgi:hypothetical protein
LSISVLEGSYQESLWKLPSETSVMIEGVDKETAVVMLRLQNDNVLIYCTSGLMLFFFLLIETLLLLDVDLSIYDLTVVFIEIKPLRKGFINYNSAGTFTLKDCVIKISEIFNSWEQSETVSSKTFIQLSSGDFFFENVEFNNIELGGGNTFISVTMYGGKLFTVVNCKFINCGCDNSGKIIHLHGSSLCNILGSHFVSCFSGAGGAIFVEGTVELTLVDCVFQGCMANGSGGGGSFFFLFLKIFFLFF